MHTFVLLTLKCIDMKLRVKEICKEKGITMESLSDLLKITPNTLTRNVNGNPTIETLEKMASALEIQITELFERPKTGFTALVDSNGALYRANSIEELESIIETIKMQS